MSQYILTINPATPGTSTHDPCAAIFDESGIIFAVEEERLTRDKHAFNQFPDQAINACLDHCNIGLSDIGKIVITWQPKKKVKHDFWREVQGLKRKRRLYRLVGAFSRYKEAKNMVTETIRMNLTNISREHPDLIYRNHHLCHAASAFFPSGFENSLVLSVDGRGEKEATVVWSGTSEGLERLRTYSYPQSLGRLYSLITKFLGYRVNNGEGKVMGLAGYGTRNNNIETTLKEEITLGINYDVSDITGAEDGVAALEELFGRQRVSDPGQFSQWEKDLAKVIQCLLEDTILEIVETYAKEHGLNNLALAGGVALNCKLNKRLMESDTVNSLFIQPVAHDAGTVIGAGFLEKTGNHLRSMPSIYLGPDYSTNEIKENLDQCKLDYIQAEDIEQRTAKHLANGKLIGWYQGRLELGPRALGNRSILADPRKLESRDRINEFVKHREDWRPFAPSILEEAADDYLRNAQSAPYMIRSFDLVEEKKGEIPGVLHPGDETTRPQIVSKDNNLQYYKLIREFEKITGVPVLLNTSFNDHGEPIVNAPLEAIKDFFGMGLDVLVMDEFILMKNS